MKFKVGRTSNYYFQSEEPDIELNSLEELLAFCRRFKEEIILTHDDQNELMLEIYDAIRE